MKILFATPFLPSPARFGAQRRVEGLMRSLAEKHEVSLLSFATNVPGVDRGGHDLAEAKRATRAYCRKVVTVPFDVLNVERKRKRLLQVASLASPQSFERLAMWRAEFQLALNELLDAEHYDVVQVEFAQMGAYRLARRAGGSPLFVLDEHNIEFDLLRRTAMASLDPARKLYGAVNWRKVRREEVAAWRRFDGITLSTERDRALLLRKFPCGRTEVVPNGVDVDAFSPADSPADPATLLFLGALNYYPNIDAILHFLDDTLPLIREQRPDVRVQVVGSEPPVSVRERQSDWIEIDSLTDDPRPHLDRATVVVVPLRIGRGSRFGTIEAMAMGKAIVSTSLGVDGIEVLHERHVLIADTPEAFADQVLRALSDRDLARYLGTGARRLAETRYGWRTAAARLEDFYEELAAMPVLEYPAPLLAY